VELVVRGVGVDGAVGSDKDGPVAELIRVARHSGVDADLYFNLVLPCSGTDAEDEGGFFLVLDEEEGLVGA
jgi:hypothetical protein